MSSDNNNMISKLIDLKQAEALVELLKKQEPKKEEKKPWFWLDPKTAIRVYILAVLAYPIIGAGYKWILYRMLGW